MFQTMFEINCMQKLICLYEDIIIAIIKINNPPTIKLHIDYVYSFLTFIKLVPNLPTNIHWNLNTPINLF